MDEFERIKTGGLAQCGYPATHNCNYNVYYDIKDIGIHALLVGVTEHFTPQLCLN